MDLARWEFVFVVFGVALAAFGIAVAAFGVTHMRPLIGKTFAVIGTILTGVSAVLLLVFSGARVQFPISFRSPVIFPIPTISAESEPKNVPTLRVEGETFQLSFGGLTSGGPVSAAEGQAAAFPCFGTDPWITPSGKRTKALGCFVESCPVHVFIEHGFLYLNTAIYGGPLPCVQINHNRVIPDSLMFHPNWDFNSNDRALEVIDEFGFPMFQMFVEPPNRLTVRGVFPFPNDEVLIQDIDKGYPSAFFDARSGPNQWRIDFHLKAKPLFKYPSWRHPGELAD